MSRLKIALLTFISVFLLSSCSLGRLVADVIIEKSTGNGTGIYPISTIRNNMLNSTEKSANARMEQVIDAIKSQSHEDLQVVFSENALDSMDDFDGAAEDLFNFIQGDIESWEKLSGLYSHESTDSGHKTQEVSSYYHVNTDTDQYFFLLRDYLTDTEHPDNVGLYLLLVVRAADEDRIWDGTQKIIYDGNTKLSNAGIYLPI